MPSVSVIIPAFNCERFIGETIQSALDQSFLDLEVIVVDDGSSDNTRKAIEPYEDKITYLYQKNSGVGAARNAGMAIARGKYLAFLDHDDVWHSDKIERQIELLQQRPEVGLVYSDCHIVTAEGDPIERYFRRMVPPRGMVFETLFVDNFIPLCTVVVPTEVIGRVGNFRRDWSITQDYDLWLRIAKTHSVDCIGEPLAKYRLHSGGSSRRVARFLEENLMLAKEYLERYPELGALSNRKLRALYYDAAFAYLSQRQLREARKYFLNVLKADTFAPKALSYYLLSFLGFGAVNRVWALKRVLSA